MSHMSLSLNDAFSLVRSRKSNVGPNFHFMEQLHAFERELMNSSKRSGQSSIDSGDGGGDESGVSSASSSGDRKCDQCGTPRISTTCSRCQAAAAHFLSPLTVFGQSPDSGIEFDRWTPGTGEWDLAQGIEQAPAHTHFPSFNWFPADGYYLVDFIPLTPPILTFNYQCVLFLYLICNTVLFRKLFLSVLIEILNILNICTERRWRRRGGRAKARVVRQLYREMN